MAPLRFRAWHKKEKRWINLNGFSTQFNCCEVPGLTDTVVEQGNLYEIPVEQVVVMQSTGLTDKNDKEIFEGDILRYDFFRNDGVMNYGGEVIFDVRKAAFGVEYTDGEIHYFGDTIFKQGCEFIGNMYEHSDLLPS